MTDGTGSLGGDMRVECVAECGQVQMTVDPVELAASLDHPNGAPTQRHGAVCQFFMLLNLWTCSAFTLT